MSVESIRSVSRTAHLDQTAATPPMAKHQVGDLQQPIQRICMDGLDLQQPICMDGLDSLFSVPKLNIHDRMPLMSFST